MANKYISKQRQQTQAPITNLKVVSTGKISYTVAMVTEHSNLQKDIYTGRQTDRQTDRRDRHTGDRH